MKKSIAYPSALDTFDSSSNREFNVQKWGELVSQIYHDVHSGKRTYDSAVDLYAKTLDVENGEDTNFKHWIKYYKNGEHLKYSEEKAEMKKEAVYNIDMLSGTYNHDNYAITYDSLDGGNKGRSVYESAVDSAKNSMDQGESYKAWKRKLHGAIRRIDKLLRDSEDYINPDQYEEISGLLHSLDLQIGKVRLASTASDLLMKTASKLHMLGHKNGASMLIKVAQENVAQQPQSVESVESPPQSAIPSQPSPAVDAPPIDQKPKTKREEVADKLDQIEPVGIETLNAPGPAPGEYEALGGNITLEGASKKLEEVAGMLADRRIVRLLAEFDIMLDKIGIAAMFPELAEAQSKLIDAHSYALTRVTKMMGMISSGRQLLESAMPGDDKAAIPGAEQTDDSLNAPVPGVNDETGAV